MTEIFNNPIIRILGITLALGLPLGYLQYVITRFTKHWFWHWIFTILTFTLATIMLIGSQFANGQNWMDLILAVMGMVVLGTGLVTTLFSLALKKLKKPV